MTLSSAEAEYVVASMCAQEVVYLRVLLESFGAKQAGPTEVCEDNAVCITISENPVNHSFTSHIDVRRYFVRDLVLEGVVKLIKGAGTENITDALTKSLPAQNFHKHHPWMVGTRREYKAFLTTWACLLSLLQPEEDEFANTFTPCKGERMQFEH